MKVQCAPCEESCGNPETVTSNRKPGHRRKRIPRRKLNSHGFSNSKLIRAHRRELAVFGTRNPARTLGAGSRPLRHPAKRQGKPLRALRMSCQRSVGALKCEHLAYRRFQKCQIPFVCREIGANVCSLISPNPAPTYRDNPANCDFFD